jgi:hypothetical protein
MIHVFGQAIQSLANSVARSWTRTHLAIQSTPENLGSAYLTPARVSRGQGGITLGLEQG